MTELRASHADRDRVVEILRIDALGGDTQRSGNIMVRPAAGRQRPVILRIEMSGENVAGWLVAHAHRHPFFL